MIFTESTHDFRTVKLMGPTACIHIHCSGEHSGLKHKPFDLWICHRGYELNSEQKHLSRLVPHFEDALRQGSRIFDETAKKYGSKTHWPKVVGR